MDKNIYFEPAGRIHSSMWELINNPPDGYKFIISERIPDSAVNAILNTNIISHFIVGTLLNNFIPISLTKARLERFFKKCPKGTDITFTYNHPVFRNEPWIVFVERGYMLLGYHPKHLKITKYRKLVEDSFAKETCKKIITWSEAAKKSILMNYDCRKFEQKIEVVPLATRRKNTHKVYDNAKIRLIFVGSSNIPRISLYKQNLFVYDFYQKGGHEVLEAFTELSRKYGNLELIVRARVPPSIKHKFQKQANVTFIEETIPRPQLESLFNSSDIFLYPGRDTVFGVILDAMSYELPVITTNVFGNGELVQDGKTGFLVRKPTLLPEDYYLGNFSPSEWLRICKTLDVGIVRDLVEKTSLLIENRELARKMGSAGRWEIEHGRHSIEYRNSKFKAIFDSALNLEA